MKKKIFMMAALCGVLLPLNANALTGNVNLSCEKTTLAPGATTTCSIKGNVTGEVAAVSIKLEVGENLTLTNVTTDSIWQGDGAGGDIQLYTDTNKSGNFNIAIFTVKAGSEGTANISLSDVNLTDANFEETSFTVSPLSISISKVETPDDSKEEESTGGAETPTPGDNNNSDKVETPDDSKEEESTGGAETPTPENDKEGVVENPSTGLCISFGIIGTIILSIVTFVIVKKKNYFSKI